MSEQTYLEGLTLEQVERDDFDVDRFVPGKLDVGWAPQAGSQTAFLNCPAFEVLYHGTRGPGKTDALLMSFAREVGRGFGTAWRGVIFREQGTQLVDVVAKSKKWFYTLFPGARYIGGEGRLWRFPDGEELMFRHMRREDDYWGYHGHEYPFIGWEELTNWARSDCYASMMSCCRSSARVFDRETGRPMPRMIRATCNPYGVGHSWVKSWFIDKARVMEPWFDEYGRSRVHIFGSLFENKILMEVDPMYIANLKAVVDPNKRKAWLEGSWDIVAGGMFDDLWDANVHVISQPASLDGLNLNRAFDWGASKPFSVGWYGEARQDVDVPLVDGQNLYLLKGDIIRLREWYGWNGSPNEGLNMANGDIAQGIKRREAEYFPGRQVLPGPADPSIFPGKRMRVNAVSNEMQAAAGIKFVEAARGPGSRINGWQACRTVLHNALNPEREGPAFFVTENCPQWIRTVPVLPRDKREMDDVDSDAEDHVGDEWRYRIYKGSSKLARKPVRGR